MATTLAVYLASLDDFAAMAPPETYFDSASSTASSSSAAGVGPLILLRPILASVCTTPASLSPPFSRPLSRWSSTDASKAVRFARCTNASVFPVCSGDEYDRSPIIPTLESESLALPKRHSHDGAGAGAWIKCVERERADLLGTGRYAKKQTTNTSVEGVNGLLDVDDAKSRFFRAAADPLSPADAEPAAADAEDEGVPSLIQDDSSGDDSSSSDAPLDARPHDLAADDADVSSLNLNLNLSLDLNLNCTSGLGLGLGLMELSETLVPAAPVDDFDEPKRATTTTAAGEQTRREEECRKRKERFGMCALGKYTRAEVFATHDSLGGF